ncbi:hypothetical protein DSO57_1029411 [Entomophthora muscae]|uniref:Uncharacterized protein n=1 Tax=Entomophthora muscae TaxID=34485 RepID=A0ACC2TZW2_9FUNG|nr:hypothetical protein DSO57_1029411 [Entomophthora muscae]
MKLSIISFIALSVVAQGATGKAPTEIEEPAGAKSAPPTAIPSDPASAPKDSEAGPTSAGPTSAVDEAQNPSTRKAGRCS